jgi:hypothetical protein
MRLSLLLFGLYQVLWVSSKTNAPFKKFIRKAKVRLMIKTEDGRHARLFVFDQGKVSTKKGADHEFDVALVWKDPKSAFSVMLKQDMESIFFAAADGKLKIEGMPAYAQWFDKAMGHII